MSRKSPASAPVTSMPGAVLVTIVVYHNAWYVRLPSAPLPARLPVNIGPTSAPTPRQKALAKGDVVVRPVTSLADFHACVDLQRDIWGPEWSDTVPASMLQVASYVGGIVLGAF